MRNWLVIVASATQRSKGLDELPNVDIAITMGCGDWCPNIRCDQWLEWRIADPSGGSDEEFIKVAKEIEKKIMELI